MTHVALYTTFFEPEKVGIAPYATELAEGLADRGASVTVSVPYPHYPLWSQETNGRGRFRTREHLGAIDVRRGRIFVPANQNALRRAGYELTSGIQAMAARPRHPSAVVAIVPNVLPGLAALRVARRADVPLIVIAQDLSGPAADQSGIDNGSGVASVVRRIEQRLFTGADRVVVVSDGFRSYLEELGTPVEGTTTIRNWYRPKEPSAGRAETRRHHGWEPEDLVVVHAGNIGNKQALHELGPLFEAAGAYPSFRFVFVGGGNGVDRFRPLVDAYRNVELHDPVSDEDHAALLAAADIGLLKERATLRDMSLPSKLTGYFGTGLPVLALTDPHGTSGAEMKRSGAGLTVHPDDGAGIAAALAAMDDAAERARLAAAARQFAQLQLSREECRGQLMDLILGARKIGAVATNGGSARVV